MWKRIEKEKKKIYKFKQSYKKQKSKKNYLKKHDAQRATNKM